MARLVIDTWQTYCGDCGKTTAYDEEGHLTQVGWEAINGLPGCGAKWTGVTSNYTNLPQDWIDNGFPDHFPEWVRQLPIESIFFDA